ncbi:MAG: TetR/AcrR family transcriptional regulator [Muribaculaceae bacterium]|nr:TetR/AcrR family transcriptional regulator [Muribaculaceae bacterium]
MQHPDSLQDNRSQMIGKILPIITEKGLKATTMDLVAQRLGISKRTLYEVFPSKSEMLKEALQALGNQTQAYLTKAFAESDNVMEALITIFKHNRDLIGAVNINFYRDMDHLYKDKRQAYDHTRDVHHEKMMHLYRLGVEQGMFRPDVDYEVQGRMIGLQMEALKRVEELFPAGITLQRVFDSIIVGFLRSIASDKGRKVLENLTKDIT